ncbi:MAG: hypothetical protein A7315_04490 [Candidatus Altiarchaeales archaeon WOR_SM1_79]|jgi:hypothetical protein|nr:MAG: hypothetical protein A7315_04490 [Candidatus Altiarchaeales archaeon WOR_SM1_79]
MPRYLKRLFFILIILCIPAGFLTQHEHAVFLWHKIPSADAMFGVLGALLILLAIKIVASFASRKEDFYD